MKQDQYKPRHLLKNGCLVAGLVSMLTLVLLIASSIEKVNAGSGAGIFRSVWLLDFNWVAALILLIVSVVALLAGLWLWNLETRQMRARLGPGQS